VLVLTVQIGILVIHLKILPFEPQTDCPCPGLIRRDLLDPEHPDWLKPKSFVPTPVKAIVLFGEMILENFRKGESLNGSSNPLTWPLFLGHWLCHYSKADRYVVCMGNVLVYWPTFIAVLSNLVFVWERGMLSLSLSSSWTTSYFLSLFLFLFTRRETYISDYAISFIFGLFLLIATIDNHFNPSLKSFILIVVAVFAIVGFLLWSPLVYGLLVVDLPFLVWCRRWVA
jgi:hypothetical protein